MEGTPRMSGNQLKNRFSEESPQISTKPVASSTFMASKTEFDFKDFDNSFQSPKPPSLSSLSTASSLGVLDLEKQSLLFDEREVSALYQNSEQFLKGGRSVNFLQRFSDRLSNIGGKLNTLTTGSTASPGNSAKVTENRNTSTIRDNCVKLPFQSPSSKVSYQSGFSSVSSFNSVVSDSFESGKQAVLKLDADQKENRKKFGSLPVSPTNISMNSENIDEREKRFTECIQDKCYSPEDIGNVLRNKQVPFDKKIQIGPETIRIYPPSIAEIEKKFSDRLSIISDVSNMTSKYSRTTSVSIGNQNGNSGNISTERESEMILPKTEFQFNDTLNSDIKIVEADSTFMHSAWEDSCASSIASIHEIAEALKRKSLVADPRRAVEHLLSIGRSKQKFTPQMSPVPDHKDEESHVEMFTTPSISKSAAVSTPSTITCPTNAVKIDSGTGKVYSDTESTITNHARHILQEANRKLSQLDYEIKQSIPKKPVKYFHLVKSSSLLDFISNDQKSNARDFWKLNPENNECLNILSDTLNHTVGDSIRDWSSNSFKINGLSEPVRRVSNFHDSIYLNSFNADSSCSENICAGVLCIGTQVEVIIAIENPVNVPLKYKVNLKSVIANEIQNLSAASIILVDDGPEINLLPNVENEIKIMLSPLVLGRIEVQLEFVSEDTSFSNIFRCIKVIGERPKLKLLYPEDGDINYGVIIEGESRMASLRLKNEGLARLPLKLVISEENETRIMTAKTIVEPADIFDCNIRVKTTEIYNVWSNLTHLNGRLDISLDTAEELTLAKIINLQSIKLNVQIAKVNLLVNDGQPFVISCSPQLKTVNSEMKVENTSNVALDISIKVIGSHSEDFDLEPKLFNLSPHHEQNLKIMFHPRSKDRKREVEVKFSVAGSTKVFSCPVIGLLEMDPNLTMSTASPISIKRANDLCLTPQSNSSSSGSTGADGPMELDSTHSAVSWESVPIHSKSIQTITLRNRNYQREKLLLSISDSTETFKFIEHGVTFRDMKLTLEPNESRKISIQFMPFLADHAINGRIIIMRRHSLETSISEIRKRVIPLYGIGGTAKVTFSGIFRDNENRLWITPDSETHDTKFTVENTGDSVGFVKFIPEDTDDILIPNELILLPKESAEVIYNLHLSKDRLDLLYKQNPQKDVLLANKVMVLSGCESTRLRLKRLWFKYKEFENIQRFKDKVEMLMQMTTQGKVHVDALADNQSTLNKLWCEGVAEQSIGVVIYQQHLESACLDSTVVFKDLNDQTTILP